MAGYVLIVESDPELQKRISDVLREASYELAAETEGAWAKRSVAVRTPDAVVLDTRLSDTDGFRVAEELRKDPDTRATPILFVATTHRGASHRAEARRRFAPADYLSMPVDFGSLLPRLLELVPPGGKPDEGAGAIPKAHLPAVSAAAAAAAEAVTRDPAQVRERRDVERSARTLSAEKAELQGTLKRAPFARLLQRLYQQKASGALLLLRDDTKKIVSFVDGYPVSVRSNVLAECLGQILLSQRLISDKALAQSVARMQHEKRHQGQILVEMGALSPFNLQRALVAQMEAKLFEVFGWRDGKFMFKEGGPAPREPLRLDWPPAALILEGIRRHYDGDRQAAVLASYAGNYVTLNPDPMLRLQEMTADPTEVQFIQSIDGVQRLEATLEGAKIPRDKARLLLVALSEAGMIRPAEAPPTPARRKAQASPPAGASVAAPQAVPAVVTAGAAAVGVAATGAVVASAAQQQQFTGALAAGQLAMVVETVRTQDYFWTLGVERDATTSDIDHAYEMQARLFHADRYRNSSEDDRRTAQEIFDRLGEAHRVLRDPARRRAYVTKLSKAEDKAREAAPPYMDTGVEPAGRPAGPPPSSAANAAARSLYEAGLEHLRARRHHEAVEVFRQAARLVPNEAEYRAALGWALFREAPADARAGRAALAELRRALQLDGRNRRAFMYLAQYHAQTGQPDLAIKELERLLSIDPTANEAVEELRRLREEG